MGNKTENESQNKLHHPPKPEKKKQEKNIPESKKKNLGC